MNYRRVEQVALGLIAVFMLPAGLQATFAPRSFFDDFPLGRSWIAQGDAYNEHLVFHAGHLDGFETVDKIGLIGSLVTVPVLALLALWAGRAGHSMTNR